jgi:monoamine oxidase
MAHANPEVVIVGGGSAGIAAGRRLREAAVDCLIVEARSRLGGRAWTITDRAGSALDLGCGWLHSADRNPWRKLGEEQRRTIDKTLPPWGRPSLSIGFPLAEQSDYRDASRAFYAGLEKAAADPRDGPASALLQPNGRWNNLINAVSTYISGTELDRVSVHDFDRYDDNGVNWRVVEGYGTTIVAAAAHLPIALDCPVRRINHAGKRLIIETAKGNITADRAIVTLPSNILAEDEHLFAPALPDKAEAARGLPLGLADKLFLSLENAEEFEKDTRVFGRTDRTGTAIYHFRPFGRPLIEAYFGGRQAAALESEGERGFFAFAVSELTGVLGTDFATRIKPIHSHSWGRDPFARGSYSCALPGKADGRATLAAPVDDRLFFAGEACSRHDFSTAHGGWLTGVAAADAVIEVRKRQSLKSG